MVGYCTKQIHRLIQGLRKFVVVEYYFNRERLFEGSISRGISRNKKICLQLLADSMLT